MISFLINKSSFITSVQPYQFVLLTAKPYLLGVIERVHPLTIIDTLYQMDFAVVFR